MNDPAHIRLVDAHAEGNGCYHHACIVANEGFLIAATLFGIQAGVIRQSRDTVRLQLQSELVDAFT